MNNVYQRNIAVAAGYAALAATPTIVTVTISCPPANVAVVNFLADDGTDVPWQPGEWHTFHGVDLSQIQIKGAVGDTVTLNGGTW